MGKPGLGPVIIGFDGSYSATCTVRVAASLLAPAPASVVVAWEAGSASRSSRTLPVSSRQRST